MLACRMSHAEIGLAIGCSADTLEKYFAHELQYGAARRRREVVGLLFTAARAGNISAQRKLHDITGVGGAAEEFIEAARSEATAAPGQPKPKLGKKEQAAIDAKVPDMSTEIGEIMARRGGAAVH